MANVVYSSTILIEVDKNAPAFWWSIHSIKPCDSCGAFVAYPKNKSEDRTGFSIQTKSSVETRGDDPGLAYNAQAYFGKTIDELMEAKDVLVSSDLYADVSEWPSHYIVHHPADHITKQVMEDAVRKLYRDLFTVLVSEVVYVDEPSKEQVDKSYKDWIRWKKENPQGYTLEFSPEALESLEPEDVERFEGVENIVKGFFDDDGNLCAELKDGTTRVLGPPKLKIVDAD